ncbi:TauD/TfdA family dioxygenase [Candidatus Pelagisphaera phototrophica]|uniref:TauD/TfdA family dioxygenase n=1 Tax=Candidatus Pelagisphaera phototrophica TaxID=2684113 RepID=UPI0024B78B5E|nr:TauD/TfdA family dioxygenase [Candidatus Pelagisphaera phototrophica]QXD32008.1 TauD/TfdA family dioxygenase [Candidatus Pelagisphaera phototrophica]
MTRSILAGPAVWKGDGLSQSPDWKWDFSNTDPRAIREALESGPGALMLHGFPIDQYDRNEAREAFRSWCGELGNLLAQNERGDTVFEVTDAGFGSSDLRIRGPNTNKKLSFHTDRCDVIVFLCWKKALIGGENEVVSSMHLYNEIAQRRPDLLKILMESFTYKRHTVDLGNESRYCQQPIFSFRNGFFACSFLRVLIDRAHADPELPDLTPQQIEAIDFLEVVAGEPGQSCRFMQERGDILILNNWVTLHRRTAFEDGESPEEKRRIFRTWLSMPNSRPIDERFEANFGATGAGKVRGGFPVLRDE